MTSLELREGNKWGNKNNSVGIVVAVTKGELFFRSTQCRNGNNVARPFVTPVGRAKKREEFELAQSRRNQENGGQTKVPRNSPSRRTTWTVKGKEEEEDEDGKQLEWK